MRFGMEGKRGREDRRIGGQEERRTGGRCEEGGERKEEGIR
jgi:hypothetical protein